MKTADHLIIFLLSTIAVALVLGITTSIDHSKRIALLENQLGLMRVTYIHSTNGIAEITTGFTIDKATDLYALLKKVQSEKETPTNSTTLEISNASSKTITVTLPNGVQWKEAK